MLRNQTIQQELEAKRDTLCQLLNLKPASLIDSPSATSRSPTALTTDKDSSNCAAKFLASLVNGSCRPTTEASTHCSEMRNLESWHDEDEEPIDDSCYQELVDPSNSNGWSADEMFKYNERMHKITSSYNERTLSDNYTTPLPKINSKTTMRLATQLAKEIEERVIAEGRITPESSDDDELFKAERMKRVQLKQKKQHLRQQKQHQMSMMKNVATTSGGSSSRNILRTCLTSGYNIYV